MSSSLISGRRMMAALTFLAAAVLLGLCLVPGSARAASETSGKLTFNLTSGKAGKVTAVKPAKAVKRFGKKGAKVTAAARNGVVNSNSKASLKASGGLRFAIGKRKVTVTGFEVSVFAKQTVIRGKVGGKKIKFFNVAGKAKVNKTAGTAKLSASKLSLTNQAAKQIRKKLKLKKAPTGKLGTFALNLLVKPSVPDYSKECGVPIASRQDGSWPAASALPTLSDPVATTGPESIEWGFKSSFRGYIFGFTGANALQALDGASRSTLPSPMDPTRGFSFPVSDAQFAANDPSDPSDDQAVIPGKGTGLFCNSAHFFWAAISDPTVVIDGENSRIVATVSQNINGNGMFGEDGPWQTPVRIDLANLDLSGATRSFNHDGTVLNWDNIPVTLTSAAAPFATYPAGTALDPISVSVSTESPTPFPQETYCSVTQTTTISSWPESLPAPASFSAGSATSSPVTSGGLDWGIRQGLRGSNPYNPIVVSTSPDVTPSNPSDMTGAGKFFSWESTSGNYYSDGRLVLPLSGTVGLCSQSHGYGSVVSNPKVVIDDANSRIVADVAARVGVDWVRAQVDLVSFDASAITPTTTPVSGGTEYTWTVSDGSVKLTEAGAAVYGPIGAGGPSNPYVAGADFQGFSVTATVPAE